MKFSGVLIAPLTPVQPTGGINFAALENLINYLLAGGVDGICVGGGTAEYPHFDLEERKELIRETARVMGGRARLMASIGFSTTPKVVELGQHAGWVGAEALLVPMPHFFRYAQNDLEEFCRQVSRRLPTPCFLYNLPAFTSPLELETSIRLLEEEANVLGIKDSSGNPEALQRLVSTREGNGDRISLFIGKDALIHEALEAGWDGIISGLGNLCPELIALLYRSFRNGDLEKSKACQREIDWMSDWFGRFPVPWAIRFGLEVRGLPMGPPALPVAPSRKDEIRSFQRQYEDWIQKTLPTLLS